MTRLKQALWALVFIAILGAVGKLGVDHYQADSVAAADAAKSSIVTLTSDNFKTTITTGTPILLVVCTTDICGELQASLADVQKEYLGKVKVVLLDAKANAELYASLMQIVGSVLGPVTRAYPTEFMLNKDTIPADYKIGLVSTEELKAMIDKVINPVAPEAPKAN
jgi:thioredoxin-like negative regulator of GroEL